MYPQRANIPLQGLDRRALAVGAISGPYVQPNWSPPLAPFHHHTVMDLHGRQKALWKSRLVDISQWRQ